MQNLLKNRHILHSLILKQTTDTNTYTRKQRLCFTMCQAKLLDSRQAWGGLSAEYAAGFFPMLSKHWKPLLFRFTSQSLLCAEAQVWVLSKETVRGRETEFPKDIHKFLECKWWVALLLWLWGEGEPCCCFQVSRRQMTAPRRIFHLTTLLQWSIKMNIHREYLLSKSR